MRKEANDLIKRGSDSNDMTLVRLGINITNNISQKEAEAVELSDKIKDLQNELGTVKANGI